jgi:hypothetical protein
MTAFKSSASEVMAKVKAALESVQQCHIRLSELRRQKQAYLWELVKSLVCFIPVNHLIGRISQ